MKRRAFSLVEVLVVIAIIGILASLLVIGINHLQNSAKHRQTEETLANCQAMFAEYDASQRPSYRNAGAMPCPQNVTAELAASNDRYGAAVIFTRDIMLQLKAFPVNATALGKMPADTLMTFPSSSLPTPPSWSSGGTAYGVYARVTYGATATYICVQANNSSPSNAPGNVAYWMAESSDPSIPIPLDAWGNPIIFVSSTLGADPSTYTLNTNGTVPAGSGGLVAGGNKFQVRAPDGRPFFASAGPDGDFSKGDDNVYSFEK